MMWVDQHTADFESMEANVTFVGDTDFTEKLSSMWPFNDVNGVRRACELSLWLDYRNVTVLM